jgi:hypothetical protein
VQEADVAVGCTVLKRTLDCGQPKSATIDP